MTYLALILAYLLGSIPFGVILSKAMGAGDLRSIGSGNIGATNALRTGNKKLAAFTLLGDMLKGTAAVLVARLLIPEETLSPAIEPSIVVDSIYVAIAGLAAVLGHVFPVWLKFKGGKGVATALGVLLGLAPLAFLAAIATWLGMFKWKKISSLAALTAFALAPFYCWLAGDARAALVVLFISILIFITHRENIGRLIRGEESTFKNKKTET